ncbi:MAG TPA: prolyl oligopeptidase family serine peptidase [Planctomycetaceae bacterium]|nr:prolyl oligopeptidase family serine peptidase [Planctomycetaceae bacterium]
MSRIAIVWLLVVAGRFLEGSAGAQAYGPADRGEPGDIVVQAYLARVADELHAKFADDVKSPEAWTSRREQYRQEYFHMLGLWPLPERTPLEARVTGTYEGEGFVVEKLHYQSRPRLYVTANLYRPAQVEEGRKLPAVLYVCGHSNRGRNGNKTAYQSHGIWFARHGYVCLMVDTLQLGEIGATHHGTYREGRWWWHSRGYTPAGVECWNGVRGIDYLVSRPDVDPERIAVTGISGGGAATFWVAAADERVKVAVPVSGMADLPSYVSNRVINGHCDCMFLYNTFQWPWVRIAALIAPRPMLFTNSDNDVIFPMDANDRLINRLERVYSLYGASDAVDAMVSIGGHAYREDLRKAAYRFINMHLKGDPRPVTDSEVDLVTGDRNDSRHPIPPEELRVFPTDDDLPDDELNTTIDEHFVAIAEVAVPEKGEFDGWKEKLLGELRRVTFGSLPERIPAANAIKDTPPFASALAGANHEIDENGYGVIHVETEPRIRVPLRFFPMMKPGPRPKRILLVVNNSDSEAGKADWVRGLEREGDQVLWIEPRGIGDTRWTRKDPPNYAERSHVLLGRTVDTGRVRDVIASARFLKASLSETGSSGTTPHVIVAGRGPAGLIAAYAAVLEPEIDGAIVHDPPTTHMDSAAAQFLNILRVCDVAEMLGLLAPRPLTLSGRLDSRLEKTRAIYSAAGNPERLTWKP